MSLTSFSSVRPFLCVRESFHSACAYSVENEPNTTVELSSPALDSLLSIVAFNHHFWAGHKLVLLPTRPAHWLSDHIAIWSLDNPKDSDINYFLLFNHVSVLNRVNYPYICISNTTRMFCWYLIDFSIFYCFQFVCFLQFGILLSQKLVYRTCVVRMIVMFIDLYFAICIIDEEEQVWW